MCVPQNMNDYEKCMKALVDAGADINIVNDEGFDVMSFLSSDGWPSELREFYPFVDLPLERLPRFFQMVESRSKLEKETDIGKKWDIAKKIGEKMASKYMKLQHAKEEVAKKKEEKKKKKEIQKAIEEDRRKRGHCASCACDGEEPSKKQKRK